MDFIACFYLLFLFNLQSILLLVFTIYFCLTCNRFHRLFSPHFRSSVDEDTTPRDGDSRGELPTFEKEEKKTALRQKMRSVRTLT